MPHKRAGMARATANNGRGRQLIRVDINCHRKRITAPLTLVLALMKDVAFAATRAPCFHENRDIFAFSRTSISVEYMHFSKSSYKLDAVPTLK
jgi:hypothetical protein